MENNKNAVSGTSASSVAGFAVTVIMGLLGLATAGLIIYEVARAFLRHAFDIELPNPFS